MKIFNFLLLLFLLWPAEMQAQGRKGTTIAELVTYNGADREQVLYAGAKTEGKLTWYTSLAGDSYKGMVKAFETKYPGVKIEAYRVSGSDMTTRLFEESKAKRYIADTVETTEGNLMFMRDAFLLRPYHSPHFASYPEDAKEKGERGLYFWAIARESYIGFAYNKKLLSKGAVPKNFEGLLHPELKGRMGVSLSDPIYKMIGAMLKTKGQEFVKKLKVQEIAPHTIIPPALLDLIGLGEVLASPGIFAITYWLPLRKARRWSGCRWISSRPTSAAPRLPPNRRILMPPCFWRITSWDPKGKPFWQTTSTAAPPRISVSNGGGRTMESAPTSTKKNSNAGRNY